MATCNGCILTISTVSGNYFALYDQAPFMFQMTDVRVPGNNIAMRGRQVHPDLTSDMYFNLTLSDDGRMLVGTERLFQTFKNGRPCPNTGQSVQVVFVR